MKNSRIIIITVTIVFVTFFSRSSDVLLLTGLVPSSAVQAAAISPATERVNLTSGGAQATADSSLASISVDGRFVAFQSNATDLVVADTNGFQDVFVRDRVNGLTERVSVSTGGGQGNSSSGNLSNLVGAPTVSADGRFVAFQSHASNLVAGDTNGFTDIFVRDRVAGTTTLVVFSTLGAQANSSSYTPAISADGRYVAFGSIATNLVVEPNLNQGDVYLRDRVSGTTERVSVGPGAVFALSISANGRYVAYARASGDPGTFVRDRVNGSTERVDVTPGGGTPGIPLRGSRLAISADGRYVAFSSGSSNLITGDTNSHEDIFLRDRALATTERISLPQGGG